MTCIPLQRFWYAQISDMCELAPVPPRCCGCISPPEAEWRGRDVRQMNVAECRQAARDMRAQVWVEQCKGMGLVVGAFFSAVGLAIMALIVAGLVFEATSMLLSSLFAIPAIGLVFSIVIYSFELINLALGSLVLIGKFATKVLVPSAVNSYRYAEFLETNASQLEQAGRQER